ncbi:hypothetical protein MLD52_09565 [Puniceicoccaceae bacterium K14]|nr:hypothetical protein [Puniceicoccaceae bacterium K14]
MQQHVNSHTFRAKDVDRTIAAYGSKPPQDVKQKLMRELSKSRSEFIERYRVREVKQAKEMTAANKKNRGR